MKFVDLKTSLKNEILPAYSLAGDDVFLLYKSLELIKNKAVPFLPEFNQIIFSENAIYSAKELVESLQELPLGQDLRFVVVYDCSLKATNENLNLVKEYLKNPNTMAVLVFFNSKKNEFVEKLKDVEVVDCNKLGTDIVQKLILQKCNENQKAINPDACSLLALYCLNNLARIYKEIDKLISYVGDEKIITKEDVELNVVKELDFFSYEFAQAVASKQQGRAFEILNELGTEPENLGFIISFLYNQFSKMFLISVSKKDDEELSKIFGVKPFAIKKTRELIANFTKLKLKNIMELISNKEFQFKSGKISQNNLCENLIFSIMNVV